MSFITQLISKSRNPVLRNTIIYTAAAGVNASIPFFILPVLTSYLTPAEYGIVSTFMIFNSVFLIVIGIEQHAFIGVNYYSKPIDVIQKYVTGVTFTSFIVFILCLSGTAIAAMFYDKIFEVRSQWIIYSVVVAFAQFLFQLHLSLWQLESKPVQYGIYQVIGSAVNYTVSIVLIAQFHLADKGRMLGIIVASLVFGLISLIYLIRRGFVSMNIDRSVMKLSLLYSIPLIPHAFAGWINTSLDRLIINTYVGVSETGIYSVGFQIALIISLFAGSFNKAFVPYIYETLNGGGESGKLRLVRYTYYYFGILVFAAVFLSSLIFPILKLLVKEEYYHAQEYIYWIICGFTMDGLYYGVINYIYYSRKTYYVSIITISSSILHFAISIYLIPRIGGVGAAYSTAISFFFAFIGAWIISAKVFPMPWMKLKSLFSERT